MALVKLGATIVGISGTIGGITFAHNRAGWTAKPWAASSNPRSLKQQDIRNKLAQLPLIWRGMGPVLQTAWNGLAAAPPEVDKDPFGVVVLRSGFQWFVRINTRRLQSGQTIDTTVPTSPVLTAPAITAFTWTVPIPDPAACRITWLIMEFLPGERCTAKVAVGTGSGVATLYRDYRWICSVPAYGITLVDVGILLRDTYGDLPIGARAVLHAYRQAEDGVRSIATVVPILTAAVP